MNPTIFSPKTYIRLTLRSKVYQKWTNFQKMLIDWICLYSHKLQNATVFLCVFWIHEKAHKELEKTINTHSEFHNFLILLILSLVFLFFFIYLYFRYTLICLNYNFFMQIITIFLSIIFGVSNYSVKSKFWS